ncbi:MAG: tetratricopeptide repeat protein [Spirochaetes bacterium]|jgi:tetratricopeptide (TPR) repeat protein|nr:tetratricopeptide repeat protein [Spirochaetota bacterium]
MISDGHAGIYSKYLACCMIAVIINSCINYKPVRFSRTITITNYKTEKMDKEGSTKTDFSGHYLSSNNGKKGYIADNKNKGKQFYSIRYFAEMNSSGPLAKMNNKGVDYALDGKFIEAKYIFEETLKEDGKFAPACNNLGIIFELFNRREDAFSMYSKACIIDPDNEHYRNNFFYFQEPK